MSAPAYTCPPERLGGEVLLDMLDRGFRHFPVLTARGEILGVIEDRDLVAAHTRSSFFLRARIASARSVPELVAAARDLAPAVVAMHDARLAAISITAIYAVVVDALTRRLLELALETVPAERAALLLLDPTGAFIAAAALERRGRTEPFPVSRKVIERVAKEGSAVLANLFAWGGHEPVHVTYEAVAQDHSYLQAPIWSAREARWVKRRVLAALDSLEAPALL